MTTKGLLNLMPRSGRNDDYFNYYLRGARLAAGYTQRKLGEMAGAPKGMVIHYERLRCMPGPEIAARLASVLGKRVEDIFPDRLRRMMGEIYCERSPLVQRTIAELRKDEDLDPVLKEGRIAMIESIVNSVSLNGALEYGPGKGSDAELRVDEDLKSLGNPIVPDRALEYALGVESDSESKVIQSDLVAKLLSFLPSREREMIELRYGLGEDVPWSSLRISAHYGLSRQRINQIEANALTRLRRYAWLMSESRAGVREMMKDGFQRAFGNLSDLGRRVILARYGPNFSTREAVQCRYKVADIKIQLIEKFFLNSLREFFWVSDTEKIDPKHFLPLLLSGFESK